MKHHSSSLFLITITVAVGFLASCNRSVVYSHYEHLDPGDWRQGETVSFTIDDIPVADRYAPLLGLRTTMAYPYADLSLIVSMATATQQRADTITVNIMDSNSGQPRGTGIAYRSHTIPLPELSLAAGDTLRLYVSHNMRCEMLRGVSEIGITMEKADKKAK